MKVRLGARVALPSDVLPGEVYTTGQLQSMGVGLGLLRGPQFVRLEHGIYTRADNPGLGSYGLQVRAAVVATGGIGVVTGLTALRLWGIQLPDRLAADTRIHLLVPRGTIRPRRPGVVVHQSRNLSELQTATLRGLTLATPLEAWWQLAAIANHEELVQIGEGLIRRKNPISDLVAIRVFLEHRGGGPIARRMTTVLSDMRPGTDSIRETQMRRWIVNDGLPEPQVNAVIVDTHGQFLAMVDGFIETYHTVVEYDGAVHNPEANRIRDNDRRRRLRHHGYPVVVATASDIADPSRFLAEVRATLATQAANLGLTPPPTRRSR